MKMLTTAYWGGMIMGYAMFVSVSTAGAVVWSESYTGEQLADTPWTAPSSYEILPGGILETTGSESYAGLTTSEWNPGPLATLEFTVSITTAGTPGSWAQGAAAFTSFGAWQILIDTNRVTLYGATSVEYSANFNGSLFNTYRLVISGGSADLYLNANATPIITGVGATPHSTAGFLYLGDYGGSQTGTGAWQAVQWSNDSALPVPEPASMVMLGMAGVCLVFLARRGGSKVSELC